MPIEVINVGAVPDDGTGDLYRVAMQKVNASLAYLDGAKANAADVAIALDTKVDKVAGSRLITTTEANKLAGIAAGATVNSTDAQLRDRSTHTGEQAISTISGLQAALDAKAPIASPALTGTPTAPTPAVGTNTTQLQTTAGALAQMQAFGLGNTAGVNIASLETHRTSGAFLADATVSTAGGLPLSLQHIITYRPGTSAANGEMWATPLTTAAANGKRVFFRKLNSNVWQPWIEFASLDSPIFTGTPVTPNLKLSNVASADVNTLDYYEEGSFTPTLEAGTNAGSPTYSTRAGRYTRIGNRVFWSMHFTLTSKGGATGQINIGGLPFVVANTSVARGGVAIGYITGLAVTAGTPISMFHAFNQSRLTMYKQSAASGSAALVDTDILDSLTFYASGQHEV